MCIFIFALTSQIDPDEENAAKSNEKNHSKRVRTKSDKYSDSIHVFPESSSNVKCNAVVVYILYRLCMLLGHILQVQRIFRYFSGCLFICRGSALRRLLVDSFVALENFLRLFIVNFRYNEMIIVYKTRISTSI